MGFLKRKATPSDANPPAKSAKVTKHSRPSKPAATHTLANVAADDAKLSKASVLVRDEEPMFPRGGASILTPIERREIGLRAKADAASDGVSGAQNENPGREAGEARRKAMRATRKNKRSDISREREGGDSGIKVESLSFKKLMKGSLVLAQVLDINALEVTLAMPNSLLGYASIVAISDFVTKKLQQEAAADYGEENGEDEKEEGEPPLELNTLLRVGQYVRASVISTSEEAALNKAKRRIQLSLRPSDSNFGLTSENLVVNSTVMASVLSAEEHGCVMDIGLGAGLSGFLSRKQIDPATEEDQLQPGAVFLCAVKGKGTNSGVVQLSTVPGTLGSTKNTPSEAPTINIFLPGTLVDLLIVSTSSRGITGKVLGSLNATADIIHSGAGPLNIDIETKYKVGSRVKARVVCNFLASDVPKIGVSILPHIMSISPQMLQLEDEKRHPLEAQAIGSFVERCIVCRVDEQIGLYVDIGLPGARGFIHISRVKDGKIDALFQTSGPYQVGSIHRGRVVGYSHIDGLFHLSLEQSVLDQKYIRLEDVPVGAVVTGQIERTNVDHEGLCSLVVRISADISGLVVSKHFADVQLQHPEKMFREGMKVKARVLSVDFVKRQMRLTLKKTLVNSDSPVVDSYDKAEVGMQIPGTIIKIEPIGAQIRFYGMLKGFLPTSEMSEAYIVNPVEHFRTGQVVSVHVLEVKPESRRLIVSCKDPSAFGVEKQVALRQLNVGDMVSGRVTEKSENDVCLELVEGELKAILAVGHLGDKSSSKSRATLRRLHVGQTLADLMVLDKNEARRSVILTMKPSLLKAKKEGKFIANYDEAKEGMVVQGFVRNIASTGVVVSLGGSIHGILPGSRLPKETQEMKDWGMEKYQPVLVAIRSLNRENNRMLFSLHSDDAPGQQKRHNKQSSNPRAAAINPVDESITAAEDLGLGTVTKARVHAVKETQLNVRIADNIQARIDVSQIYDSWNDIPKPKKPLHRFRAGQIISVRVIGVHDARNHTFLPFSHRSTHSLLELSAKPSDLEREDVDVLSIDSIGVGTSHIAFVNNVTPHCIWVNLSPKLRGRIAAADASDDMSQLADLARYFPIGSAIRVRVQSKDERTNRLDLTARPLGSQGAAITWDTLEQNMVVPGRVTKVTERQIIVHLSDAVSGPVHLPDMSDDFDEINLSKWKKNDIIRVAAVEIDSANKRLRLSTRPSRILSSTLPVIDPEICQASQLRSGDLVRGFVKNVSDKGLFVLLGGSVTAMAKISNLSDRFIKEWKDGFRIDQLVKGRVISVDHATGQVELSLKASVVDSHYVRLKAYEDFKKGDIVAGKVRKVEEFGAFVVIDGSNNVSGLCHRSQMADETVKDANKLYSEGDVVKALILDVDPGKRRVSFGLKPSLFADEEDTDMGDPDNVLGPDSDGEESDDDASFSGLPLIAELEVGSDLSAGGDAGIDEVHGETEDNEIAGVDVDMADDSKYDWMGDVFENDDKNGASHRQIDGAGPRPADKRKRAEPQVDRTAELDAHGPQTANDYERLLLGQPDSSALWIAYMAFQMQVGDLSKSRETAERAISTINMREETEKLNVWVAYLNLEVTYGSKGSIEEVFARACRFNDEQEVHERLASIYIQSGKHEAADALFEAMVKKFGSESPQVWTNYAHFLHATIGSPARARALLPRATQALESRHQIPLSTRFAALEFRSPHGEPERGRTMFEGLLATFPKKGDLWSQLLDLEMGRTKTTVETVGTAQSDVARKQPVSDEMIKAVRDVFDRRTRVHGLKPKQAVTWFGKWADWEEKVAGKKGRERVVAKTEEWVNDFKARREGEGA